MSYHSGTGKLRFLGTPPSITLPQPLSIHPDAIPEVAARSFLNVYGSLFGISDPERELHVKKSRQLRNGRSVIKFKQVHQGIPVIGGEIIVNMDKAKNIKSINGEVSPEISLDVTPVIDSQEAREMAIGWVSKKYDLPAKNLKILSSELSIYNPVLLGFQMNENFLVWKIIVQAKGGRIKEFVLIDAKTSMIHLHFNQIHSILNREIYDNENDPFWDIPGLGPVRSEGDPVSDIPDVDDAYDYLGDTYNFYFNTHGRDSIDGAGMELIATVRYCPDYANCPYRNAFWNGEQMVFGDGFAAADDVVAHELTHGVTEDESQLFYIMQSGAINESLSDVWGELIDQWNGTGTDTANVKWLMGEDVPKIGAIRSMKNPPAFGHPDSMLSSRYYCGLKDNGGVHRNSGVNNKAAYLLTDGDTFNGYTINGLGIERVAKLYYEVQTNRLTSASDHQDLADALYQGCLDLVGSVTTALDCNEVFKTIKAVHMESLPGKCKNIDVALCNNPDATATDLFFGDVLDDPGNPAGGNWISGSYWYYPQNPNLYTEFDATYTTSGIYNIYGAEYWDPTDSNIAMSSSYFLPPMSNIFMHFNHSYAFLFAKAYPSGANINLNGGVLEYTTNGVNWYDAKDLMVVNGYNGKINNLYGSYYGNNLAGRPAFVKVGKGYVSTKLDLSSLAGMNVRFRFRMGTIDSCWAFGTYPPYCPVSLGWFIDDVRIYSCDIPDPDSMILYSPNGGEPLKPDDLVNIMWGGPSDMAYVNLSYSIDGGVTWKTIEKYVSGTEYDWIMPRQTGNKTKCLVKVAGFNSKGVSIGSDKSDGQFSIEVVKLTYPNGGDPPLISGVPVDITWTTNQTKSSVATVKLFYSIDNGKTWKPIPGTITGNPESHSWTPSVSTLKDKCKVKVILKDAAGNSVGSDMSDSVFTIQATSP
jgi:Zn-dependent metalloprotease